MIVVELRIDAHCRHRGFGQLQIRIRTDRIVLQADVILEIVSVVVPQHTVVDVERTGQVEACDTPAARDIRIEPLVHGRRFDQLVDPVVVRVEHRVVPTAGMFDLVLRIGQRRLRVTRQHGLVGQLHVGNVVGETEIAGIGRNGVLGAEVELRLPLAAALGIDQHHAVGTPGTVNRRGRCILQHREVGDVVRLETGQVGR